jgi:hypothetical protein
MDTKHLLLLGGGNKWCIEGIPKSPGKCLEFDGAARRELGSSLLLNRQCTSVFIHQMSFDGHSKREAKRP